MISVLELDYYDCIEVINNDDLNKLFEIFNRLGLKWLSGDSYINNGNVITPVYLRPIKGTYNTDESIIHLYGLKVYKSYQIKEFSICNRNNNLKEILK
jgi:hypothetical protein